MGIFVHFMMFVQFPCIMTTQMMMQPCDCAHEQFFSRQPLEANVFIKFSHLKIIESFYVLVYYEVFGRRNVIVLYFQI